MDKLGLAEPRIHELKTWPPYFEAIKTGEKNFEVRRDDRGFQRGDTLRLLYFDPRNSWQTRPPIERRISYILTGGRFGIEPGFVVLGLEQMPEGKS
jgi:hypothetical protein